MNVINENSFPDGYIKAFDDNREGPVGSPMNIKVLFKVLFYAIEELQVEVTRLQKEVEENKRDLRLEKDNNLVS